MRSLRSDSFVQESLSSGSPLTGGWISWDWLGRTSSTTETAALAVVVVLVMPEYLLIKLNTVLCHKRLFSCFKTQWPCESHQHFRLPFSSHIRIRLGVRSSFNSGKLPQTSPGNKHQAYLIRKIQKLARNFKLLANVESRYAITQNTAEVLWGMNHEHWSRPVFTKVWLGWRVFFQVFKILPGP